MSEKETTKLIKEYIKCVEPEELYKSFIEDTIVPEWVLPNQGCNLYITDDLPTGICTKKIFALDYPNEIFSFFKEVVKRNKNHIILDTKIPENLPLLVSEYETISSNDVKLNPNDYIIDGRFNVYMVTINNTSSQDSVVIPVCSLDVFKGVQYDIWDLYIGYSIMECTEITIHAITDNNIPATSITLEGGNCKITHSTNDLGEVTLNFEIYGICNTKLIHFNLSRIPLNDTCIN